MNELETTLTRTIALGQDPKKAINEIARQMNTSKVNAGRLVMTESAAISEQASHDSLQELDVELYEILATLDGSTSEICQSLDGKVFKMSEWKIGATAPPFHVNCRTTTVPAFDDEFDDISERAARDREGETYYVPSDMTYPEWKKAFVGGDKRGLRIEQVKYAEKIATKAPMKKSMSSVAKFDEDVTIKYIKEVLIPTQKTDTIVSRQSIHRQGTELFLKRAAKLAAKNE